MVLLELPKEMTGPADVKMKLKHENRTFRHGMVHTNTGWVSTACDSSSHTPGTYAI